MPDWQPAFVDRDQFCFVNLTSFRLVQTMGLAKSLLKRNQSRIRRVVDPGAEFAGWVDMEWATRQYPMKSKPTNFISPVVYLFPAGVEWKSIPFMYKVRCP